MNMQSAAFSSKQESEAEHMGGQDTDNRRKMKKNLRLSEYVKGAQKDIDKWKEEL